MATSGGNVLIYNLGCDKPSKPVIQLGDTNRSVNSLSFNTVSSNQLLVGTGDGTVRLWDIRESSRRGVNFTKNGDSARELQWKPFDSRKFAVIYDSGIVQRWDIRNPSAPDKRMNAHVGVGLTLQWHPELDFIASGGRDCQIQVWNMSSESRNPDNVLYSPAAVNKVRWQTDSSRTANLMNTNIISCCRSKTDFGIYIWTLRRPYIPIHIVQEHSDSVSDVCYGKDRSLWSISTDRTFVCHDISQEPLAVDSLCSTPISWLADNSSSFIVQDKHRDHFMGTRVVFSMDDEVVPQSVLPSSEDFHHGNRRQSISVSQTPPQKSSFVGISSSGITNSGPSNSGMPSASGVGGSLSNVPNTSKRGSFNNRSNSTVSALQVLCNASFPNQDSEIFEFLAEKYLIFPKNGETLIDLCRNNAQVATRALRFRTSASWSILLQQVLQEQIRFDEELASGQLKPFMTVANTKVEHSGSGTSKVVSTSKITESLKGLPKSPDLNTSVSSDVIPSVSFDSLEMQQQQQLGLKPDMHFPYNSMATTAHSALAISPTTSHISESTTVEPVQVPNMTSGRPTNASDLPGTIPEGYSFYGSGISPDEMFEGESSSLSRSATAAAATNYTHLSMIHRTNMGNSASTTDSLSEGIETVESVRKGATDIRMSSMLDEIKEDDSDTSSLPKHDRSLRYQGMSVDSIESRIPFETKGPGIGGGTDSESHNNAYINSFNASQLKLCFDNFRSLQNHPWAPENLIRKLIEYSLADGDLQLVSILTIMFAERYPNALPTSKVQEECIHSYLQLLRRARVFSSAAEIIKFSKFNSIRQLAFSETSLDLLCHRCMTPLVENGQAKDRGVPKSKIGFWYCDSCRKILSGCVMCNEPIKGLAIGLLTCGHKVHMDCMKEWVFTDGMMECPAGCGNILGDVPL